MKKALMIVGMLLSASISQAQVLGLQPEPLGTYYWDANTSSWAACPNSDTAEPLANTPEPTAFYGLNSARGQWVPMAGDFFMDAYSTGNIASQTDGGWHPPRIRTHWRETR